MRWYLRETYGPVMWWRLVGALSGLPAAFRARRPLGALAGVLAAALAILIAVMLLLNVVAYPFRPFVGLHGNDGGGIWASTYHDSWGGPSLAGAWLVHAAQMMLIVFPAMAWAVRGLLRLRDRTVTP